jgi:hypothetical protein
MDRHYYQTLMVPAGTPITAPVSESWPLEDNLLLEFTVQVPDGHCGLTGFRVLQAQQQLVPFANDTYIVSDDRVFTFSWQDEMTVSGLVLEGYNDDIFEHGFYCTATVRNLPLPAATPEQVASAAAAPEDLSDLTEDYLSPDSLLDEDETSIPPPAAPVTPVTKPPPAKKKVVKKPPKKKLGTKPPVKKPGPVRIR